MIRSLYYLPGKPVRTDLTPQELVAAIKNRRGLLWVDFVAEPPETCEPILRGFGFHPLAIQDALQQMHAPKLDDWGQYLYIVINTLSFSDTNGGLDSVIDEIDAFLGPNYVVTHHDEPVAAIDEAYSACQRDLRHLKDGADHLLYRILDYLVAGYMPLIQQIDQEVDNLEDQVFGDPTPRTVERLFSLKRTLLSMRRILTPQREVLNKLARDDFRVIDPHDRVFFRDIYDHLVRLHDINESLRDLVGGALDTYLSVINNRMNEVMKTLTIITTLFMPISFITGFFGMNFFGPVANLDRWTAGTAFAITLAIFILVPTIMLFWIRSRRWI